MRTSIVLCGVFFLASGIVQAQFFKQKKPDNSLDYQKCNREYKGLLQDGDIVFTHDNNMILKNLSELQQITTTHLGVAYYEDGDWFVYHSTRPRSVMTEFCEFIDDSHLDKFAILRAKQELDAAFAGKNAQCGPTKYGHSLQHDI